MDENNSRLPEAPVSRTEHFLARLAGEPVELPEPVSREELYLKAICDNAGGGGGIVTVDSELSEESVNPVQNKVVTGAIRNLSAKLTTQILASIPQETIAYAPIADFSDGADGLPAKNLVIDITPVQSGTGDPSPTNVRAISGWTGCNLVSCGMNLTRATSDPLHPDIGFNSSGGGTVAMKYSESEGAYYTTSHRDFAIIAPADGTYTVSFTAKRRTEGSSTYAILGFGNKFPSRTSEYSNDFVRYTRTFSGIKKGGRIGDFTVYETLYIKDITITYTNKYEDFTPFVGPGTIPISWDTEAGTVYGGTLDVLTGVLTETHANIASYAGETINEPWISSMDVYSAGATPTTGAQVVYPLTTAQTYQLTPTEVKTLLGANNIWANTGNVGSLTYRADPQMYVDKRINATKSIIAGVEATMTATKNYTTGDLLIVGDALYTVTVNIANGGSITPGTNVNTTTVAEQLLALANA